MEIKVKKVKIKFKSISLWDIDRRITMLWHFGNTTVRNPKRIKEGLAVLANSSLNGNLIGKEREELFAKELHKHGVINLGQDPAFFGRKWRVCFSQLGFITHKFKRTLKPGEEDPQVAEVVKNHKDIELNGLPFEITPSGRRLIDAETVPEEQECFLRSLVAYEIPSVIENRYKLEKPFKPFIFILQVLKKLEDLGFNKGLTKLEMGIVQSYDSHTDIEKVILEIEDYRKNRKMIENRVPKRRYDNKKAKEIGLRKGVQASTVNDYADINFRYPRLTGLVSLSRGRLVINSEKREQVDLILENEPAFSSNERTVDYLYKLWNGAGLPTDDKTIALQEIRKSSEVLKSKGRSPEVDLGVIKSSSVHDVNQVRLRLEAELLDALEEEYGLVQVSEKDEIIQYLKILDDKKSVSSSEGLIEIDDEPAFLEWAVWRSFLTFPEVITPPDEARRFKVDQDFLPLGCAPGGGPDIIFEFDNFLLVVEVTLTTSSRQEAAEGEPVRRHVAMEQIKMQSNTKPVYGLFLARSIDLNTAETFRNGVWYHKNETLFLNIVPLNLKDFIRIMERHAKKEVSSKELEYLLNSCLIYRNAHAPDWMNQIKQQIEKFTLIEVE